MFENQAESLNGRYKTTISPLLAVDESIHFSVIILEAGWIHA